MVAFHVFTASTLLEIAYVAICLPLESGIMLIIFAQKGCGFSELCNLHALIGLCFRAYVTNSA